jgi:class 3 adenylate cyclase
MNIEESQLEKGVINIINEEKTIFNNPIKVTNRNGIPNTADIPLEKPNYWLEIPDVICVYVDMINSTQLSAETQNRSLAKAYRLFTNSIVRIFDYYESPYIDIKGDGVFALFNSSTPYKALVAAVTVKTVVENFIEPKIKSITGESHGAHIGIDQKTVLVRKLGFKRFADRTDRQNEVWAGKVVNMAAKLASLSKARQLLVSDRYFKSLKNSLVLKSCGCGSESRQPVDLWEEVIVSDEDKFDFKKAYLLESQWCSIHGLEFIKKILKLDGE